MRLAARLAPGCETEVCSTVDIADGVDRSSPFAKA